MPPSHFPLRWESTGDQWWYASPIDWAAANGHYDLVRELLRIDNNQLINLTSLRRIRRLETVWDDEEQFDDVAKCRSQVARKLFLECKSKKRKNPLIRSGYGGWLVYTAASAGDLSFVLELLERDPLLVFGEREYGVTDILYAAARSKNSEVFRLLLDFSISPRILTGKGRELEEHIGDIPSAFKWEMMNRAVHAAARGGNLKILQELLGNCSDVLSLRDIQGSTVLHAAAARGQVEVVKELIAHFDIISSIDNQGNTALHIASYRGQLPVVQTLLIACPSLISSRNNAGETFLHTAVSGFHTPAFRRLDRQIELMKHLVRGKVSNIASIINAKNNNGRTALHMAIVGNIQSDLVQLLMTVRSININIRDADGMTPLDLLKQRPRSASSEVLIRQLISAGGVFGCQDNTARRVILSHLKMQGTGHSPGTTFRISDAEIFLYTGIENTSDSSADQGGIRTSSASTEVMQVDPSNETHYSSNKKPDSVNSAAERLKGVFKWPRTKAKEPEKAKDSMEVSSAESCKKWSMSDEPPTPLRQRFSKPSSTPPNTKRSLSVRSNISSPSTKKKLTSGLVHGVMQAMPHLTIPAHSPSNSLLKSPFSSSHSMDKQKGLSMDSDDVGTSCSNQVSSRGTLNVIEKQHMGHKRSRSRYFCFRSSMLSVNSPIWRQQQTQSHKGSVLCVS